MTFPAFHHQGVVDVLIVSHQLRLLLLAEKIFAERQTRKAALCDGEVEISIYEYFRERTARMLTI